MMDIVMLLAGLGLLILGGELLVRGAVKVAEHYRVSPLLIGLTLVGFGTSMPELVTSVNAAMIGSPGIAVGNIVGSNISNILLILGLSAMINPITVENAALRRDGSFVLITAALFLALGQLGLPLGMLAGALLVSLLVAYIVYAYLQERTAPELGHGAAYEKAEAYGELHENPLQPVQTRNGPGILVPALMALAGLAIVVVGGKLLVDAAISIARGYAISETVIGLTIVAVGTSMPELVTSVVAAMRGHSAVALGNILGSNIYNVLGIGGVTGLISPTVIPPQIVAFDNPVMVGASLTMLLVAWTGLKIGRLEGSALVAGYVAYVYLIWPK